MSSCCCQNLCPMSCGCANNGNNEGCGFSKCNFSGLVILILILLQFKSGGRCCKEEVDCCDAPVIDRGILFIVAIFYLSCTCFR